MHDPVRCGPAASRLPLPLPPPAALRPRLHSPPRLRSLADIADFKTVNAIYAKCAPRWRCPLSCRAHCRCRAHGTTSPSRAADFPEEPPARATFAVKDLPLAARVEIDAIALVK